MRWPALFTPSSRWPSSSSSLAVGLGLPDLFHDDPCQLLGLVVRWDPVVDNVGEDEANVAMRRRCVVEDDLCLAAGRLVAEVGVDDHEVKEVAADMAFR